ncbi:MAG TPA: hypothetical protein DIU20_11500 [Cryomorphaceae bacterium]|nr:hypothetical protein [Cryomorphaceae bacterium]
MLVQKNPKVRDLGTQDDKEPESMVKAGNKSNKCHPEWPTEGRLYRRVLNEGHPSIRSLRLYLADQSLRMTLT